ncbi:hypothetical protein Tco_1030222 [Tanacetum coccineum]|uniref:Uncharacterized protein n=1 Tax=Tanacetum coccineum TaxID=301880 RepID=A0ABQ5G5M8_9ASTR
MGRMGRNCFVRLDSKLRGFKASIILLIFDSWDSWDFLDQRLASIDEDRKKCDGVGESSTARPTGDWGIDNGFVSTVDAEARRQGISEVGYGIRDTWVDPCRGDSIIEEEEANALPLRGLGSLDKD